MFLIGLYLALCGGPHVVSMLRSFGLLAYLACLSGRSRVVLIILI